MSREFWDERFDRTDYLYGVEPNAWLVRNRHLMVPGQTALAVADGEGRNGVWLAGQGLDVTSVDQSPVALKKALRLAMDRGVSVRTECADLTTWDWPEAAFDVVAAVFIHFRPEIRAEMHARMLGALKPGGLMVLEAFRPEQLDHGTGGPPVREMLYTPDDLKSDFATAEILDLHEAEVDMDEGPGHKGTGATVRLAARRLE